MDDSVFLSRLVLWNNDPGLIEEIFPHARAGSVTAQYAFGLIYAEGRGVEQDNKQAYLWLSRAYENGDTDAELLLSIVKQSMTFADIEAADRLLDADRR